jgi:hypothetical protein
VETESVIRAVIESTAALCHEQPDWLDEVLVGRPPAQIQQAKDLFGGVGVPVLDAFPTAVPKAPMVVVLPADITSLQEFIGSYLGEYAVTNTPPTTGTETWDTGDMVSSGTYIATYSPSALLCRAVSQVMWWASMVAKRDIFEIQDGLYEMKCSLGPLDISQEWSTMQNADVVYRRVVTLTWKEIFQHSTAFTGVLLEKVIVVLHDVYGEVPA